MRAAAGARSPAAAAATGRRSGVSGTPRYTERLSAVAEQPLHRALGLTDWEFARIRRAPRPRPERLRARGLLGLVVGALRLQALGAAPARAALDRGARAPGPRRERRASSTSVTALAVAFKVESHNHPTAVEPFQGAATGVGGILRDIVAMGARPVALLDGLRFGAPDWHFRRAVAGIGQYGNCGRRPHGRRRDGLRRGLRREPAGQRDVRRPAAERAACCARRRRHRATRSCSTARSPGATGSAAPRCSQARISRARATSGRRSRSATRSAARR